MAEVIFFEKPGCVNNTRQKKLLMQAGHRVICRDLLQEVWTEEWLLSFFKQLPVALWFNNSAPRIKSGEIVPPKCEVRIALQLMINEPLLIRRPLMQAGNETMVGFDYSRVNEWIGLEQDSVDYELEQCPKNENNAKCADGVV